MMTDFSITISDRNISENDPCYVIAEVGVNHNGRLELAHKLIDIAKNCGADAVKFQTFDAKSLATENAPKADYQKVTDGDSGQLEMLSKLELSHDAFFELRHHCKDVGIDFISTAFDTESLDAVISMKPACLKWPSGELTNLPFLRQAAKAQLPIVLSTGMGRISEVSAAVELLAEMNVKDVAILQCVSSYPARIEDQNLRTIPAMSKLFGVPVGFSDHTVGIHAALVARALGMAVLEKHITTDRNLPGPDHAASIEPEDFKNMVEVLRRIEKGLGSGVKVPTNAEMEMRKIARKSLVFSQNLPEGHVVDDTDLVAMRPGTGVSPASLELFLGASLRQSVLRGELLEITHVQ